MATKKEILAYAKQHGFIYPKEKVILLFILLGGAVGGFVAILSMGLWLLLISILKNPSGIFDYLQYFIVSFLTIPLFMLYGILLGFIPALLTSIYLSIKEFIIIETKDYGFLFLIGSLSVLFSITILIIIADPNPFIFDFNDTILTILLAIIGGISAMICGKFFLPKLPNNF
ncbi:hypothetical protein [Moraxella equi]|uniref:Uncharacterized protein n=1 Tax=Moraxella equi TaxID=60442 RepID=A0A378QUZ1_9GAMM|nr:hypothetical protein [Moraxella equi]OPH38962.1 hypothetical protein B5J93_04740 [Moraxella equi]STZ04706.1 Uncharacterised protein [Moraxella equi]